MPKPKHTPENTDLPGQMNFFDVIDMLRALDRKRSASRRLTRPVSPARAA